MSRRWMERAGWMRRALVSKTGRAVLLGTGLWTAIAIGHAQGAKTSVNPLTALDYAQIQQLNAAYGHFIDTGEDNGNAWANLFTADGVFTRQTGDRYAGRKALADLARYRGGAKFVSHFVTNVMVEATPEGAVGRAYCVTMSFPDDKMEANDPRPSEVQLGCRYHDVYAKTPDGWRFKSRTVVVSAGHLPKR